MWPFKIQIENSSQMFSVVSTEHLAVSFVPQSFPLPTTYSLPLTGPKGSRILFTNELNRLWCIQFWKCTPIKLPPTVRSAKRSGAAQRRECKRSNQKHKGWRVDLAEPACDTTAEGREGHAGARTAWAKQTAHVWVFSLRHFLTVLLISFL